jgi:hypothetical protein
MRVTSRVLASLIVAWSSLASAQIAEPPVLLGTFAGESSPQRPRGVHLYGTDLGWTFEHDGKLIVLFGDSWQTQDTVCDALTNGLATNDDTQATLPRRYFGGVPALDFITQASAPAEVDLTRVYRAGQSLNLGANRTPLTGFSDGVRAIGAFEAASFVRCAAADGGGSGAAGVSTCNPPFVCAPNIGTCQPSPLGIPQLCDTERQVGCYEGQTCMAEPPGYCIDPSSSQPDPINQVPLEVELSVARRDRPMEWDSRFTFATNKLFNMTARTVRCLAGPGKAADYRPGDGAVLIWGRPGFYNGPGFSTELYLMVHDLPFAERASGELVFKPRYFAGLDRRGEPKWTRAQEQAVPLALDGEVSGDPTETVIPVNQMAISWLGEPIGKWVMLYGGGLITAPGTSTPASPTVAAGAIAVRFADHPWGPWSVPQTHLAAGAADRPNTPLGPGGVLFDPACVDQPSLACAPSDPVRPAHLLNPDCAPPEVETDAGHFYAPNIIDAYTRHNEHHGLEVFWNVSIWNPYRVLLFRSTFSPQP